MNVKEHEDVGGMLYESFKVALDVNDIDEASELIKEANTKGLDSLEETMRTDLRLHKEAMIELIETKESARY